MSYKAKGEIKLKETVAIAEAANRLEWILKGLLAGSITLSSGEETLKLTPSSVLDLKVKASQKKDKEKIEIEIEWRPSAFFIPVNE